MNRLTLGCLVFLAVGLTGPAALGQTLEGTWIVDRDQSVDMDPWRRFEVSLALDDDSVTIDRFWRGSSRYTQRDSITVPIGQTVETPVRPGKWMDQVYVGVFVPDDTTRTVEASLSDDGSTLTIVTLVPLESSQVDLSATVTSEYTVSDDGSTLTLTETRSTRTTGPPLRYVLARK